MALAHAYCIPPATISEDIRLGPSKELVAAYFYPTLVRYWLIVAIREGCRLCVDGDGEVVVAIDGVQYSLRSSSPFSVSVPGPPFIQPPNCYQLRP